LGTARRFLGHPIGWTLFLFASSIAGTSATAQTSSLAADKDGRIRAQLSSRNAVTISAELSARIASLPLREGDAFRAGQTLVGFDCALYQSQVSKADAAVEAANAMVQSNKRLAELGSIGQFEVQQPREELSHRKAGSARNLLQIDRLPEQQCRQHAVGRLDRRPR